MKLYLVKMQSRTNDEWFYKVGVTQFKEVKHRFTSYGTQKVHGSNLSKFEQLKRTIAGEVFIHSYDIEFVHSVEFARTDDAERTENEILEAVSVQKVCPQQEFSGRTECFSADDSQIEVVKTYMTDAATSSNTAAF